MIYNFQAHLNPRWRLVIDQYACAAFWKTNLTRTFAADLSFQIFFQDLVAKVKNLVALAPVLGAISRPDLCINRQR